MLMRCYGVREGFTEELRRELSLKEVRVFWGRGMHEERRRGERGKGVLVIGLGTGPTRDMVTVGLCCYGGQVWPGFAETGPQL